MVKSPHTVTEGIRMVGQLLLHRPTIGWFARNLKQEEVTADDKTACYFCYLGAKSVVADALHLNHADISSGCDRILINHGARVKPKFGIVGSSWDSVTETIRHDWATKLANYEGE
jgi:hypothetical protein